MREIRRGTRGRQEGGTWTSSCSKYTSKSRRGGRRGGGVIYNTGSVKQQTKGQETLRWPLVKDGKCRAVSILRYN